MIYFTKEIQQYLLLLLNRIAEVDKSMSISLEKLHFQTKVIQFTNVFMYNYDIKILI